MKVKKIIALFLVLAFNFSYVSAMKSPEDKSSKSETKEEINYDSNSEIWNKLRIAAQLPPGTSSGINIEELNSLCEQVKPILLNQPCLLEISAPTVVLGDIHGNFNALWSIYQSLTNGGTNEPRLTFLGDYVDRGQNSIEVAAMLMLLKIQHPESVFLLRGNHECEEQNLQDSDEFLSLLSECNKVFGENGPDVARDFNDVFNCLPIAAIISKRIFCVHGGISPLLTDLDQIRRINRPLQLTISEDSDEAMLVNDMLWADPCIEIPEFSPSKRGPLIAVFGIAALRGFLARFELSFILRAHEFCQDGYNYSFLNFEPDDKFRCITLFSSPNYCEAMNYAAVASIDEQLNVTIFFHAATVK